MRLASVSIVLLLSATFSWLGCSSKSSGSKTKDDAAPKKTNIILLMGDNHGWEETGYNGQHYYRSPPEPIGYFYAKSLHSARRNGEIKELYDI